MTKVTSTRKENEAFTLKIENDQEGSQNFRNLGAYVRGLQFYKIFGEIRKEIATIIETLTKKLKAKDVNKINKKVVNEENKLEEVKNKLSELLNFEEGKGPNIICIDSILKNLAGIRDSLKVGQEDIDRIISSLSEASELCPINEIKNLIITYSVADGVEKELVITEESFVSFEKVNDNDGKTEALEIMLNGEIEGVKEIPASQITDLKCEGRNGIYYKEKPRQVSKTSSPVVEKRETKPEQPKCDKNTDREKSPLRKFFATLRHNKGKAGEPLIITRLGDGDGKEETPPTNPSSNP